MKSLRFLSVVALLAACSPNDSNAPVNPVVTLEEQTWAPALNVSLAGMTKLPSGMYIQDQTVGVGATVTGLGGVRVFYNGFLANGTKFDGNVGGATPYSNTLSNLIPGWQVGMQGMKVGGKRRLVIPASMGYGTVTNGPIPANSNLVFDIEVTGIY